MTQTFYLAYGSNLNKAQMSYRCPDACVFGKGYIKDYGLVFRRGVLTVEPSKGERVPVGIWAISPEDEASLDVYEGYPHLYRKEYMKVKTKDGTVSALIYVMNERPIEPPSTRYLCTCAQGYEDFGFDDTVLFDKAQEAAYIARFNRRGSHYFSSRLRDDS
jgi:gamma-glutamylcyclotransferase (GGCT)/AIG2-like uncharacterized protein YtfP